MAKQSITGCTPQVPVEELYKLCAQLHKNCQWNDALSVCRDAKSKDPSNPSLDKIISAIQKDSEDVDQAETLRDSGRLEEASTLLRKIKQRSDLMCSSLDSDVRNIQQDLVRVRQAEEQCKKGNATEALNILERLSYDWLDSRIASIRAGKCGGPATPPTPPETTNDFSELMNKARASLDKKDYGAAARDFRAVLKLRPKDAVAASSLEYCNQRIRTDKEAMRGALKHYYSADYEQAGQSLNSIIASEDASPQSKALARFFLGAVLLNRYYLGGESSPDLMTEAFGKFRELKAEKPDFAPPLTMVSKRIIEQFNNIR